MTRYEMIEQTSGMNIKEVKDTMTWVETEIQGIQDSGHAHAMIEERSNLEEFLFLLEAKLETLTNDDDEDYYHLDMPHVFLG